MSLIHPTAIIDPAAKIAPGVKIGPYCVIGLDVEIGEGTELESHVVVEGRTVIGPHCTVYPFAALGTAPQDLKYKGEKSTLTIGAHNIIREHVTMNPGTEGGGMETVVGDRCLFMVGAHVAHDCRIGNHVIMANNATLAGHVSVGDHALIGGLAAVHQFVRIGRHAVIGGMSGVEHDVIPYGSVIGERANLAGLNLIGMKRRGFSREEIHALRAAFRELFEGEAGTLDSRAEDIGEKHALFPAVTEVVDFVRADSKRQLCVPKTIDRIIDDAA